jgi:hypothetical protein
MAMLSKRVHGSFPRLNARLAAASQEFNQFAKVRLRKRARRAGFDYAPHGISHFINMR